MNYFIVNISVLFLTYIVISEVILFLLINWIPLGQRPSQES